jgi:tetratricopeptide (TPR) repeat protein
MPEIDQLEKRVAKLERGGAGRFVVQYLLSPILVLALGFYFNLRLEQTKSEIERVEVAHKMINTALGGDYEKSFITLRLVDVVLDPELAGQIKDAVIGYYERKLAASLEEGRPEEAVEIIQAARGVAEETARELEQSLPKAEEDGREVDRLRNAEQAAQFNAHGFELLASGRYEDALENFRQAEEAYPTYGAAYEITELLERNINRMRDPDVEQRVLGVIAEQHSWKAPEQQVRELRFRSRR